MSSPPSHGETIFTPRKEFIKDQAVQPSAFALLALSGANCIRLYSFTPALIASLSRLFETHHILSFREDADQNLCEFAVDGKPWANPKSVPSEKLLVDILTIIYQCDYTFLSTIDYGREQDDRLVLTFARPAQATSFNSRTPTPVPRQSYTHDRTSGSSTALAEKARARRVPFALSFASATVMRVISPPLHLTPAILQAVRGSWPRGVVSEQKVGQNSFEFKLKGYKWFQQDTFASDSLRHILSLLTSLDSQSFTLLASLSLTNRSRVKDLWIFSAPASEESPQTTVSEAPFDHPVSAPPHTSTFGTAHRRLVTEPTVANSYSPPPQHPRFASDNQRRLPPAPHLLRKPAPRAQVPVSVIQDPDVPDELPIIRANLPSTISTGVENMTGIGASPNIVYPNSPFDNYNNGGPLTPTPRVRMGSLGNNRPLLRSASDRVKTPPYAPGSSPPFPRKATPPHSGNPTPSSERELDWTPKLPPLLGLDTFRDDTLRDSTASGNSDLSREIPIKWSGPFKDEFLIQRDMPPPKRNRASSSGPHFPGGWQPTPVSEKAETNFPENYPTEENKVTTPIHEMLSRIESPEVVRPEMPVRKSEAALVEIIRATSPAPPLPQRQPSQRREPQPPVPNSGQGWVLVNVENSANATHITSNHPQSDRPQQAETGPNPSDAPSTKSSSNSNASRPSVPSVDPSPSPAAKAIVIMDAMESKHKKSRSVANVKEGKAGGSGLKRFFSLSKKNSSQAGNERQ